LELSIVSPDFPQQVAAASEESAAASQEMYAESARMKEIVDTLAVLIKKV